MKQSKPMHSGIKDQVIIDQIPRNLGDKDQQDYDDNMIELPNYYQSGPSSNKVPTLQRIEGDGDDIIDMDQLQIGLENQEINFKVKDINQQEIDNETNHTNPKSKAIWRELKTMSSSVLDDNYFKEDTKSSEDLQMKRAQANISKIKNYFMRFRFRQFLEFFLIHFLYFQILGPMITPFLKLRGKRLAQNLQFSILNSTSIYQFILYFTNVTCLIFFFYFDNPSISIGMEMINNWSAVIARCVIIACKYATYDPLKVEIIRSGEVSIQQIEQDYFLRGWSQQDPDVVVEQIYYSVRSYDIDPGLFFLQFIVDPEEQTQNRMNDSDKQINDHMCKNYKKPVPIAKMKDKDLLYCGYSIVYDMVKYIRSKNCSLVSKLLRLTTFFSAVRCLIPIAYHFWTYGADAYGTWHEYYIAIVTAYQLYSLYSFGSKIMLYGMIDVMRKFEMLRQLTLMIAPRKLRNLDIKKIYPTINIFRSVNLKGWSLLRQVCMEYGKPYLLRIQGFFVFLGFWIAGNLSQILLYQFKMLEQNTAQTIQNYLDSVYTLSLFFAMLIYGAKINDLFEVQENILNSNKTIVSDLLLVGSRYIEKMKKSPSFIYNKAIHKIIEVEPVNIQSYVQNLVLQYDNHIEELIYDSEYNPFTLFGIKVSFVVIQSVVIAVGSVAITVITTILKQN